MIIISKSLASLAGCGLGQHPERGKAADVGELQRHGRRQPYLAHIEAGGAVGDVLDEEVASRVDLVPEGERVDERGHARALLGDVRRGVEDQRRAEREEHCGEQRPNLGDAEQEESGCAQQQHDQSRCLHDEERLLHIPGDLPEDHLQHVPLVHAVTQVRVPWQVHAVGVDHHRDGAAHVQNAVGDAREEGARDGEGRSRQQVPPEAERPERGAAERHAADPERRQQRGPAPRGLGPAGRHALAPRVGHEDRVAAPQQLGLGEHERHQRAQEAAHGQRQVGTFGELQADPDLAGGALRGCRLRTRQALGANSHGPCPKQDGRPPVQPRRGSRELPRQDATQAQPQGRAQLLLHLRQASSRLLHLVHEHSVTVQSAAQ
mmetsp:Transcript_81280/g.230273  ORF Transcript_81280/g.230273 Transcript_81280/m.230273 type:complete len:377 (-) Transcript_81280:190-1320(-)